MEKWRFSNLREEEKEIGMFADALEKDCMGFKIEGDEEVLMEKECDSWEYYNALYAYGYPLNLVYHALRKGAGYRLARIRDYFRTGHSEGEANHLRMVLGMGLLVQDDAVAEEVLDILSGAEEMMQEENCDGWSLRLTRKFARRELDEEAAQLARSILDWQAQVHAADPEKALPDRPLYCYIALRDTDTFNMDIKHYMEDGYIGSAASRKRKRSMYPNGLVDLTMCTTSAALALDSGMPLTFVDPAIPIWDFPIAQRPEIQALLPEEARRKILKP